VLERSVVARLAQGDGGRERLAGAAIVRGGLERRAEPLVDGRGVDGEPVLQRERQAAAHELDPFLELPALGARDSLQPECPRAQIGPLRAFGLLAGKVGELHGIAVVAGALQVAGRHEPLGGSLARQPVRRERLCRHPARRERALAIALQVADAGEAPLGVRQRPAGALRASRRDHLALRARGLGQLAGELRAVGVPLEHVDPLGAALALRPELERLAGESSCVAVGVHRRQVADGADQGVERAPTVPRREPVGRDLGPGPAALLELPGECPVEGTAP
jgi:hypothetical protein